MYFSQANHLNFDGESETGIYIAALEKIFDKDFLSVIVSTRKTKPNHCAFSDYPLTLIAVRRKTYILQVNVF